MRISKNKISLLIGPLIFCICYFFLPQSVFSQMSARAAVGTVAWMAFWWIMSPVDYAVTAFLPIAVNALIQIIPMESVIANYASETILLLLGASILTVSWEETGLDKRIASKFHEIVGDDLRKQVVLWFLISASLSAVLPNTVVCATITPIAVAMLKYAGEGDISKSKSGSKILITIVYATGVGGLISPLGGAMNLVAVDYIQKVTGEEFFYISWVIKLLPVSVVLVVSNILFLLRDIKKGTKIGKVEKYFEKQKDITSKMSSEEIWSLMLFFLGTFLAFARPLYQSVLPGLKPAYVFLICSILAFLITKKDGKRLMIWKNVQKKIIWDLMYIFAGGLAAGSLINGSGAAKDIGKYVASIGLKGGFVTVAIIIFITIILSDVTSNTATAAVTIPVVISIVSGVGVNPLPYIFIASIGVNLSYMFPTSIRAIPVGYGLQPKYLFKEGRKVTIIVWMLTTVIAFLLLKFWPFFSVA